MLNQTPTETPLQPDPQSQLLRDDTKFAAGKVAAFQYMTVALFLFLIAGFWNLQIQNPSVYKEQAEKNRIKSLPLVAPRGKILDRDNRVIVDNHSTFSAILSRETLKWEHLQSIADGLHLEYNDLVFKVKRYERRPRYEPVIIKQDLSSGEVAFVEAHRDPDMFPELELIRTDRRLYPKDGLAAHVVGYVAEVSETELDNADFARYSAGDIVGKTGLERQYNDVLMGKDGQRLVEVDNMGHERQLTDFKQKDAIPGRSIQLTIDLDLQVVAELALEGKRGAIVALDPRSGEVLVMASEPAYDPSKFAGRMRAADWKEITDNPYNPMLNRAIQAQQAPGSTFKPIMALAGLEEGVITDDFKVNCPGGASYYGRYFKCHKKGGHGTVELHKGIMQSCDVFFYAVANHLGIDKIAKYAEMAGFGRKTGIDLPHEASGVMPSSAWKMKNYRQKWYAGETISVGIGQGAVAVTPLQLAYAIGGIATGGVWQKPHLLKEPLRMEHARQPTLNLDNVGKVIYGMYGVVNEWGTGGKARLPNISVCGKTGTAQVISNDLAKAKKGANISEDRFKDNAWFVGFAPRENPEIVVVALYENGEHGDRAAPMVRDVLKAYFDKKARSHEAPAMIAATPPQLLAPPASPSKPARFDADPQPAANEERVP